MIFDVIEIENIINYQFNDKMLLRKCFTHASYSNEHGGENNEVLEFFGDSVLQFVVTEYLFNCTAGDEGDLTKIRANVVSKDPLLKAVKKLGLQQYMLLGKGQIKTTQQDEKLYSSLYEALIAGIYIDGGMVSVKKFIKQTLIEPFLQNQSGKKAQKEKTADYKSSLQEYVQKNKIGSVYYETLSTTGPAHKPQFRVAVLLNGNKIAEGKGFSKKNAEMLAAQTALQRLKESKK